MLKAKIRLSLSTAGVVAFALLGSAKAGDLSVEALAEIPRTASVAKWDQLYSWVDTSYQSVNLTLFSPALTAPAQITAPTWAPMRSTDPIATGYGMRGAVGFVIPGGTFSKIASDVRVQLMTSYVSAGATQGGDVNSAGPDSPLNDPITGRLGCGAVVNCLANTSPGNSYHAWQVELKAASDVTFGRIEISPSMTLFAKNANSQQSMFPGTAESNWTDVGGKIGVDTTIDITDRALFGLRGSLGAAYRATSFSSDQALFWDASFGSSMTTNASTIPLLASAEASLIWKPQSWQIFKTYAGVQFDSRVPLAPDALSSSSTGGPGAIAYETVRSFYFGGSMKVNLEGDPVRRY